MLWFSYCQQLLSLTLLLLLVDFGDFNENVKVPYKPLNAYCKVKGGPFGADGFDSKGVDFWERHRSSAVLSKSTNAEKYNSQSQGNFLNVGLNVDQDDEDGDDGEDECMATATTTATDYLGVCLGSVNCTAVIRPGAFIIPDQIGQPCIDENCTNCCRVYSCDENALCDTVNGFTRNSELNCTDTTCSNCCRQQFCASDRPVCPNGTLPNILALACNENCQNCCDEYFCQPANPPAPVAEYIRNNENICTNILCSNCFDRFCNSSACLPSEESTNLTVCQSHTNCSVCCTQNFCDNECTNMEVLIVNASTLCTTPQCTNCCRSKTCDDDGVRPDGYQRIVTETQCTDPNCINCWEQIPCPACTDPGAIPTNASSCLTDVCDNCCVQNNCTNYVATNPIPPAGFGLLPQNTNIECSLDNCSSCYFQLTCNSDLISCPVGEIRDQLITICTQPDCYNCCEPLPNCTCVSPNVRAPGQDYCLTTTDCTNCCLPGTCPTLCLDSNHIRTAATTCDSTNCNNCCRQKTCAADITCAVDEQTTSDTNCTFADCSNCCEPIPCPTSCPVNHYLNATAVNCVNSTWCPFCCIQNPVCPTCQPGDRRTNATHCLTSTQCDNCCEPMLCVDIFNTSPLCDATLGYEQLNNVVTCTDSNCTNCCRRKPCDPSGCLAQYNLYPSGDPFCLDDKCSNCCYNCPNNKLEPGEQCEYQPIPDRYITPVTESRSFSIPGVTQYNRLWSNLTCNSRCQIETCTTVPWQRVCSSEFDFLQAPFVGKVLRVPKYQSVFGIPLSQTDLFSTGKVTGNATLIDDRDPLTTRGPIKAYLEYRAALNLVSFFTLVATPNRIITTSLLPGQSISFKETIPPGPNRFFASGTATKTFTTRDPGLTNFIYTGSGNTNYETTVSAVGQSRAFGGSLSSQVDNYASAELQIRYVYEWCPTPGAQTNTFVNRGIPGCNADTIKFTDWTIPRCGDSVINQQSEECDNLQGTNSTTYCDDNCKLVVNSCGDGVICTQCGEMCDYTTSGDVFPPHLGVNGAKTRCQKVGIDPNPCQIEMTICGDNILTDNELCEYDANGGVGRFHPNQRGLGKIYCTPDCNIRSIVQPSIDDSCNCNCTTSISGCTYTLRNRGSPGTQPIITVPTISMGPVIVNLTVASSVFVPDQRSCACQCGDGIIQHVNGEECDKMGTRAFKIPNTNNICVNCKVITGRYCGDGIVDSALGENCDPPFNLAGSGYNRQTSKKYCNSKCRLTNTRTCRFRTSCGNLCNNCGGGVQNGTISCNTRIWSQATPSNYKGGCPTAGRSTKICSCNPCQGTWVNQFRGPNPICAYNTGAGGCILLQRFIITPGTKKYRFCTDQNGDLTRIGSKRYVQSSLCTDAVACKPCNETYVQTKCNVLCGVGKQVGFLNRINGPGSAATAGQQGDLLKCRVSDTNQMYTNATWVPLPTSMCQSPDCSCQGPYPIASYLRLCYHQVPPGSPFFQNVSFDIPKFFRPNIGNINGNNDPKTSLTGGIQPDSLQSFLFDSASLVTFRAKGYVQAVNTGNANVNFKMDYTPSMNLLNLDPLSGSQTTVLTLQRPTQMQSFNNIAPGAIASANFDFKITGNVVSPTSQTQLNQLQGTNDRDLLSYRITSSGFGGATGGGSVRQTISGSFESEFVILYQYLRCDIAQPGFPDTYQPPQTTQCLADVKISNHQISG